MASIREQLTREKARVRAVVQAALTAGAQRIRTRIITERLSGPPGVTPRTGRLRGSLRVTATPMSIEGQIGGSAAPHAARLEERGRLGFRQLFQEEARRVVGELRARLGGRR